MAKFDKELFTANLAVVRKAFPMDYESMRALGAIMTTAAGVSADKSKLEACNKLLKSQKGIFSDFRGNMRLPILVKMSMADDAAAYLEKLTTVYKDLSSSFVFGSEERLMAALILCDNCKEGQTLPMTQKVLEIYNGMKENHRWLTSQADMSFAVLMANAEGDVTARLDDVEKCYQQLTGHFAFSKNYLQTVSHILSTDKAKSEDKVERFMTLFNSFKDAGFRLTGMYMPILGVLATSDISVDEAIKITKENDAFLKKQKGFGFFGISGGERRMMAAAITALDNISNDDGSNTVVASTVLDIVIEIEMMIIMMVVISTNTAVAASSAH